VTTSDYQASLAGIAIEVKMTITLTQGKYYKWIFETTEEIVDLIF